MIKKALLTAAAVTALVAATSSRPAEAKPKNQTLCNMLYHCLYESENYCGLSVWQVLDYEEYYAEQC